MIEIEGANRAERRPLYNHIPKVILEAMAHRFEVGAVKYGRDNWKKGGPKFFEECENHLVEHLWDFVERRINEEETPLSNLEAVMWNAGAILWWMKEGKQNWENKNAKSQDVRRPAEELSESIFQKSAG